jgi:NitT/TauT family transport system ATP-binding protein
LNDVRPAGATSRFEIRIEEKTHVGVDGTLVPAIRDFVLDIVPDSMTVLMGPSGCGKTTLLRILAGLDDRFVGNIIMPENARIGLMFQAGYPQELSLGLARRVALARAFAAKPDLLLLDEPFVSLDERTADRLRKLLIEVWSARPTTAILVTHNPREAILLADQLVLLAPRPTKVVATIPITTPRAERDPDAVEAMYGDLLRQHPANFFAG